MTAPNLDFSRDRAANQRWRRRGIAFLVLGVSLQISSATWRWQNLDTMRIRLESQQHRALTKRNTADVATLTTEQRKSAQGLQDMLNHLKVPWEELLGAIEMSRTKAIVLESIQPHLEDSSLIINFNAPGFSELAEFVGALGRQGVFMDVTIVSESLSDNSSGTLRAVVRVNWLP